MRYYGLIYTVYLQLMVLAYLSNPDRDTCLYYFSRASFGMFTDIDQTDLHRSEPSSRTLLQDEHSNQ